VKIEFSINRSIGDLVNVKENDLPYSFLTAYRSFVKSTYGADLVIALAEQEGIFIILSKYRSKFIVNAQLLSEPFTITGPLDPEKQKTFFEHLIKALKEQRIADRLITPQNYVVLGAAPNGSHSCGFGSYIVDLGPPIQDLYAGIHPKHRNKISKAERAGVEIRTGKNELKTFYGLYYETMQRSGMYCEPFEFFHYLYTTLGEQNCVCAVAYHRDKPQGAILAPFTNYCCYYVYGASSGAPTESGAINFLHWKTMLLVKELGVRYYDFVGARLSDVSNTKLEGIQNFKERFGGTLRKGYLFKMDLDRAKCRLFDSMLKVNNKLKGKETFKDIIDQEIEKRSA
jgi:hypothetical protein